MTGGEHTAEVDCTPAGTLAAKRGPTRAREEALPVEEEEVFLVEEEALSVEAPSLSVEALPVEALPVEALPTEFYARPVLEVARELIGCIVEHEGLAGRIVETEAYHESEPACHAFVGLTPRTRTLFGEPGLAYVYRSYGIHALLNAVCEPHGVGAAVLIRALEPLVGVEEMRMRRSRMRETELCSGPGKLTQALGIELSRNGTSLLDGPVVIRPGGGHGGRYQGGQGDREQGDRGEGDRRAVNAGPRVVSGTRIGITKAVELRWRFCEADNPYVSRPHPVG